MNHQFEASSQLTIPHDAHTHCVIDLHTSVLAKMLAEGGEEVRECPAVYKNKTYFPLSFCGSDLAAAFEEINQTIGWTVEGRGNRISYVGELDNGRFKIRMALHHNRQSPDLVAAYPVSRVDRHSHSDFLQFDDCGALIRHRRMAAVKISKGPLLRLREIADRFISEGFIKQLCCNGCNGFHSCEGGHSRECQISHLACLWRRPSILKWGSSGYYRGWYHDSIDLGAPWYFVLDKDQSMVLVLQCCDWYPYVKLYTMPWNESQARELGAVSAEAKMHCAEKLRKNRQLRDIGIKITCDGQQGLDDIMRQGANEGKLDVIDFGLGHEEVFMILRPARYIGYKNGSRPVFVEYDAVLEAKIIELASQVKEYNQVQTDIEKKQEEIIYGPYEEVAPGQFVCYG